MKQIFLLFVVVIATACCFKKTPAQESSEQQATVIEEVAEVNMPCCEVIDDAELIIIYPNFSKIDLACGTMPLKDDESVIFVAEAAYTEKELTTFKHSNIAGDHVSSGVRHKGYRCPSNSGAFVYYNNQWKFCFENYSHELDLAAENGGAGFGQEMIIYNGEIMNTVRKDDKKNQFRALCEISNKLCIIESKNVVTFGEFKQMLKAQNVTNAIYLDMGKGWNHAWYRTDEGVVELHPKTHGYCTNWITFYNTLFTQI